MFGWFTKRKTSKRLADTIKGLEEGFRKNAPRRFVRIGLETYELPPETYSAPISNGYLERGMK